jgi:hypothetical protein
VGPSSKGKSLQSSAETVVESLQELPAERRELMETLRQVVTDSRDPRFVETMQSGMMTWVVAKSIDLVNVYYDKSLETWLRRGWKAAGLRLELGKACLRVRQISELALPVFAEVIGATTLDAYLEHPVGVSSKGRKSASATGKTGNKRVSGVGCRVSGVEVRLEQRKFQPGLSGFWGVGGGDWGNR